MGEYFWVIIWLLVFTTHYLGTYLVLNWFVTKILGLKHLYQLFLVWFFIWLSVGILFNGCPFTYVQEWVEVKAGWRNEISYKFEKSTAYKFVLHYFF